MSREIVPRKPLRSSGARYLVCEQTTALLRSERLKVINASYKHKAALRPGAATFVKRTVKINLICLLLATAALTLSVVPECHAQIDDRRVSEIRQLYQRVTQQIEESEKHGAESSIFLNELVVNKNHGSWPAVGIYESTLKFYFTFGDREKNPFPDRLLKITVTTRLSSQSNYQEFLFNSSGQLVFYFQKEDDKGASEQRYYFAANRLIKSTVGASSVVGNNLAQVNFVRNIFAQKRQLTSIFINSLAN